MYHPQHDICEIITESKFAHSGKVKNKNFNVCVVTPTNNKENFYKILKKNDILYYSVPSITEWRLNGFDEKKNIIDEDLKLPFKPDLIHIIDWLHFDSQFLYSISNLKVPIIRHYCAFEDFCYFVHPIYKKKEHYKERHKNLTEKQLRAKRQRDREYTERGGRERLR